MDTDLLRTVALVAQQGSFAAAARVLGLDPSSVSRAVATAEADLGVRLFQRSTRRLSLTEEGDLYLRRIVPLLDDLDRAREAARHGRHRPSGTLRMTASVAFAHECIVPHLGAFQSRFPDLQVELLPSDANLDLTAEGLDLAVRLAEAPRGDLIGTRLLRTRYRVCAAPGYLARHPAPEKPEDLSDHECLRFALPAFRQSWQFRRRRAKTGDPSTASSAPAPLVGATPDPMSVSVSGKLIIGNALSLRRAAVEGLGPALLADWLVQRDLAEGRLIDLFAEFECTATSFDTGAWALYPSRAYLPQRTRVMIDFLRSALTGADLGKDSGLQHSEQGHETPVSGPVDRHD